jgi:hypothetical protein
LSEKIGEISFSTSNLELPAKTITVLVHRSDNIVTQVQAQINYFRFLFKILKKLNNCVKTKDAHIIELKHNLLFYISLKMEEVKELKFVKGTTPS